MAVRTLGALIDHAVATHARPDMFRVKRRGRWVDVSSAEFAAAFAEVAAGLTALGLRRGDRLLLLSENRLEWAEVDAAAMRLGIVTVPIYPTLLPATVAYITRRSQPTAAVGSTAAQMEKLAAAARACPSLHHLVCMDDPAPAGCLPLAQLRAQGRARLAADAAAAAGPDVQPQDLASVIFTSGTTGDPKGVMLTHDNIVQNVLASLQVFDLGPADRSLSFLPLSHIFERMGGHYTMMFAGVSIAYAESIDAVAANLQEVRPTAMTAVPRVYEKIYDRVLGTALAAGPLKRWIFLWARRVGVRWARVDAARGRPAWALRLGHAVADRLVYAKLRARTGGQVRFFISGSAPLPLPIAEFFWAARLPILEGYGLTETSPVIALNTFAHRRLGSVGRPVPGVEVRILEDGEILTRSRCVMQGYWDDPQATAEAIDAEGWFHTGDIGHVDADGFLFITDRKKDLIKTSGGKWVAPQPIENELRANRYVVEAVVIGDRRNYVTALIVPNFESLKDYGRRHHLPVADVGALVRHEQVRGLYQHLVDKVNAQRPGFEQVKRFHVLDHEFSLAVGELTPSLKVRRRVIAQRYAGIIEQMYASGASTPAGTA